MKADCDEVASLVSDLKAVEDGRKDEDDDSAAETFPNEDSEGFDDRERAKMFEVAELRVETTRRELGSWRSKNAQRRVKLDRKSHKWHHHLKAICAKVRN